MTHKLDDVIKHHGVKGMKWGVRRDSKKSQNGSKKTKKPGRLKQEWNSLKRERQWRKVINNVDKMTTKEINQVAQRIQMENDLKRLSRSKVGSSKDRKDYRLRGNMTNQELSRKVNRLRAKDSLKRNVTRASKEQMDFGKKVVDYASSVLIRQALGQN